MRDNKIHFNLTVIALCIIIAAILCIYGLIMYITDNTEEYTPMPYVTVTTEVPNQ